MAALLTSRCGAGEPQNSTIRDAAMLSLWPMTVSSDETRQLVADGMREYDMGRPVEASEYFERAVAADPNAPLPHIYAWWAAQSLEAGVAHYNKAQDLAANANETEAIVLEVARGWFSNNPTAALAGARKLVALDANNPRNWIELGDAHNAMQAMDSARAAWAKAIEVSPGFAVPYFAASASYATFEPRDLAKAEQLAKKAVELEPNEAWAHDIYGDALRQLGKLEQAAEEYTKAAELDPTKGDGLQQRAHVHGFMGKFAEARADYDAAVAVATGNAKAGLGMYRGLINVYEGNPRAAIDELEKHANAIDAMNLPEPVGQKLFALMPAFNIAAVSGMVSDAKRLHATIAALADQQAAKINTDQARRNAEATTVWRAGLIAWASNDYATAKKKAAEYMAIRATETNPVRNRPAHDLLGLVAMREKRYADAIHEFEQGSINNIYMNFQHGVALESAGRHAEAHTLFEKAANYYWFNEGTAMVRNAALAKVKRTDS